MYVLHRLTSFPLIVTYQHRDVSNVVRTMILWVKVGSKIHDMLDSISCWSLQKIATQTHLIHQYRKGDRRHGVVVSGSASILMLGSSTTEPHRVCGSRCLAAFWKCMQHGTLRGGVRMGITFSSSAPRSWFPSPTWQTDQRYNRNIISVGWLCQQVTTLYPTTKSKVPRKYSRLCKCDNYNFNPRALSLPVKPA